RRLLSQGVLQLELFSERICEVEDHGVRYVLRRNEDTAAREKHRLEDKLARLESKIAARNLWAGQHPRGKPETGLRQLQGWVARHRLDELVELQIDLQEESNCLRMERKSAAIEQSWNWQGAMR
ncbi:hypothetical protein B1A_17045, partial [mine drainage metagenome]